MKTLVTGGRQWGRTYLALSNAAANLAQRMIAGGMSEMMLTVPVGTDPITLSGDWGDSDVLIVAIRHRQGQHIILGEWRFPRLEAL